MNVVERLAKILMRLPSTFSEDYPKSVPKYVVKDWEKFGDDYKELVVGLKKNFGELAAENEKLKKALESVLNDETGDLDFVQWNIKKMYEGDK